MNRKRCPWCGKKIDKEKDTIHLRDVFFSPSVPRMLRVANCAHCGHKYGQVPLFPYVLRIGLSVVLLLILAFVLKSGVLFIVAFAPLLLLHFMPYSGLGDDGKPRGENPDLLCKMAIIDKRLKIKRDELYFLDDSFDGSEPFALASPIHIYYIPKKGDIIGGEFLYMHEKNYDYMQKDCCDLYDTDMNFVAKVKFITDGDTAKKEERLG